MYNPDTEIIFPLRVLPLIADTHDANWKALVASVCARDADALQKMGLVLTLARLAGCASCNSDSFRAMRGCTLCAQQTMRRQHISGNELRHLFDQNCIEVQKYISSRKENDDITVKI